MSRMFEAAVRFLKDELNKATDVPEAERCYRLEHTMRVANYARQIALAEKQNLTVVLLGAILHDVGKFVSPTEEDHGRVSAKIAAPFLQTLNLTEKERLDIHYCIAAHVDDDAGYEYEPIHEAGTVADADNIDRFGALRTYQMMSWENLGEMSSREILEFCNKRIVIREKYLQDIEIVSSPTARQLFDRQLMAQIDYFRKLADEMAMTESTQF